MVMVMNSTDLKATNVLMSTVYPLATDSDIPMPIVMVGLILTPTGPSKMVQMLTSMIL